MKDRQPMNLKWIMFIHNVALVLVNGGGFMTALFGRSLDRLRRSPVVRLSQCIFFSSNAGTQFFRLTFKCEKFDPLSSK